MAFLAKEINDQTVNDMSHLTADSSHQINNVVFEQQLK